MVSPSNAEPKRLFYGPKPKPGFVETITADDFPVSPVFVTFSDGSNCRFRNSFYRREGEWLAVYTKSCGYHLFPIESVASVQGAIRLVEP